MMTMMASTRTRGNAIFRGCLSLLLFLTVSVTSSSLSSSSLLFEEQQNEAQEAQQQQYTYKLRNTNVNFPLVGYGVGNLQHELIVEKVSEAYQAGYRVIDTAHASQNAHLIVQGLQHARGVVSSPSSSSVSRNSLRASAGSSSSSSNGSSNGNTKEHTTDNDDTTVHIVTKIWYTYLGYERTKLGIAEILRDYQDLSNIKLHLLLHWPRCRNDIAWMHCQQEEDALPDAIKQAGPAPHLDHDAFVGSWKALEEAYGDDSNHNGIIASIGVSNFDLNDLQTLQSQATILPHILQTNVWNVVFNPPYAEYCRQHQILYQVYNVMNGIVANRRRARRAWEAVGGSAVTILQWLVTRQNMSVIPRTVNHITENAPAAVFATAHNAENMPSLGYSDKLMTRSIQALFQGKDVSPAKAVFVNKHNQNAHVYWKQQLPSTDENHEKSAADKDEHVPVHMNLAPGESFATHTHAGHTFVVVDAKNKTLRKEYQVRADLGEEEELHIEL